MQKPAILSLLVDSSRKNILSAKRVGMNCVAIKGNAANVQLLRGADLVVDSVNKFSVKEGYKVFVLLIIIISFYIIILLF
jgi:hypothetical protein